MVHDGTEFIVGDEFGVATDSTQCAEDLGASVVLGRCDPFEVGGRVVEHVAVEMVALVAIRSWSMEGCAHEGMAGFSAKMAHLWILTSRYAVATFFAGYSISRTKEMFQTLSVLIDEIAIGMGKEDFTVDKLRRHLFAAGRDDRISTHGSQGFGVRR